METYIILGNWTAQGLKAVKEAPERIEAARKATEASGGRWLGWYLTLGRYDFIVILQSPGADNAAVTLLSVAMQGFVETETLRAWTEEEFVGLVGRLP
jgi:uncharacterized protein with GYD domain